MDEILTELAQTIAAGVDGNIDEWAIANGELTMSISSQRLIDTMRFLHDDASCNFTCLIDICGVDWPGRDRRFDVVYHLLSPTQNFRVRIKLETDEASQVPSITSIYPGANWFEREAYDMFGILFSNHPDLRRILTDYGFDGHPLRKDFPLTGFVEVRYDDQLQRIVYEPVKLNQEFRNFDFESPWEGTDYVLPGDEKAQTN